jgi:uncharacterized protein
LALLARTRAMLCPFAKCADAHRRRHVLRERRVRVRSKGAPTDARHSRAASKDRHMTNDAGVKRAQSLVGRVRYVALAAAIVYAGIVGVVAFAQRSLLYFPTRGEVSGGPFAPWIESGDVWGACRKVAQPSAVWLVTHGNAGQAAHRGYVLDVLPKDASVYVLEYPGYGERSGAPSRTSIDAAARAAYRRLRELHPGVPMCVFGESIGSGPAAVLAREEPAPDAIVLVTPFGALADVAADAFPWLPVSLILQDDWDNGAALADYRGTLVILAAEHDDVIPIEHARTLAARLAKAELRVLPCGHNDWSAYVDEPLIVR